MNVSIQTDELIASREMKVLQGRICGTPSVRLCLPPGSPRCREAGGGVQGGPGFLPGPGQTLESVGTPRLSVFGGLLCTVGLRGVRWRGCHLLFSSPWVWMQGLPYSGVSGGSLRPPISFLFCLHDDICPSLLSSSAAAEQGSITLILLLARYGEIALAESFL